MEQKNVTQGFMTLLSVDGGRYMASEKQVSSNLRSSVLKEKKQTKVGESQLKSNEDAIWCWGSSGASPVQVVDVV